MKLVLLLCFSLYLFFPISANSDSRLQVGSVPVEFAKWTPVKTAYTYDDLAPDEVKLSKYRSAGFPQVDLLEKRSLKFLSNGKIEETVVLARYFLTSAGIESHGNSNVWVDSFYGKINILSAFTLTPAGDLHQVDSSTVHISGDSNSNIFSDNFMIRIPFPKLNPDTISLLIYKIEHDADRLPLPWSTVYYPKRFSHLENFDISIQWDHEEVKPSWKTDYTQLECVSQLKSVSCSAKDNDGYLDDPDIQNYRDILPQFVVSNRASWKAIGSQMYRIMEDAISDDRNIRVLTQDLIQDEEIVEKKLARIHEYVAREIRYVGIERGRGGIVPRSTATTFERKFGDCKDKVALFIEMARMAGLNAYPVLTSTYRRNPDKLMLPAHIFFNHVIACVKTGKSDERCVDLTDPFSDSTELPYYMQGNIGLRLGQSENGIINLPEQKYTWKVRFKMNNLLQQDGSLIEEFERSYQHQYGSFIRGKLAYKTRQERTNWLNDGYKAVMGKRENVKLEYTGLDTISDPMVIQSTTKYDKTFTPDNFTEFSDYEYWLKDMIKQFKSNNKNNPYEFLGLSYVGETKFTIPDNFSVNNLGANYMYEHKFGSFTRINMKTDNVITIITRVNIPRTKVSVKELSKYNKFLDFIASENKFWFSVN